MDPQFFLHMMSVGLERNHTHAKEGKELNKDTEYRKHTRGNDQ